MTEELDMYMEEALRLFSNGDHYQMMLRAKNYYFSVVGNLDEDNEDYESRMNSFSDWYLLQYQDDGYKSSLIAEYLSRFSDGEKINQYFSNVNYSLFQFMGKSFRGQWLFHDLLHNKKEVLAKNSLRPPLMEEDIIVGRIINYKNANYLLSGLCLLPKELRSILKKQVKKIRMNKNVQEELDFLLKLESIKTKWFRYKNVDPVKILSFEFSK